MQDDITPSASINPATNALMSVTDGAPLPTVLGTPTGLKVGTSVGIVPLALRQNATESQTPALAFFETADGAIGSVGADVIRFVIAAATGKLLEFRVNGSTTAMTLTEGGCLLGIGLPPRGKLHVEGEGGHAILAFTNGPEVVAVKGINEGSGHGVYGSSVNGYAGKFDGNVHVTRILSKAGGGFKIDHPLDPANQYLYHSFVESPDMKNLYDGVVTLDANGEATVTLPDWFNALNRDFCYQLTAIGAPNPNLHIAEEIRENRFKIAGGKADTKVSWQVTGIRHDPFAEQHRISVEEEKPSQERGKFLHPKEHAQPESMGIDFDTRQRMEPPVSSQ